MKVGGVMGKTNFPESKLLLEIAQAAWSGEIFEKKESLCQILLEEFHTPEKRQEAIRSIRKAMGLPAGVGDELWQDGDQEALLGLEDTYLALSDQPKELACSLDALASKASLVPLIEMLKDREQLIYATVAPAFSGQFGPDVTAGKLRSALIKLGFTDMAETALGADLVTMKEALEFCDHVNEPGDILITSCCCPVWIQLIGTRFPELKEKISPSVSPMIASGRVTKEYYPNSKVVFIGPCMAKKAEANLPDIAGAIDYVLTFQELKILFEAAGIDPSKEKDDEKAQASWAGRIFARTGGVSEAVKKTLERMAPERVVDFNPIQVDGVPDCINILEQISEGKCEYNFIEGMGCKGGCVGGPGKLVDPTAAAFEVNQYGEKSQAQTPIENPAIYALLARLGNQGDFKELRGESPVGRLLNRNFKNKE